MIASMPAPTPMKAQLRGLIVDVLYPVSANRLHLVCERFGLAAGTRDEAFSSKRLYVESRLETLPHAQVLEIAKRVVEEYPDDRLIAAIEQNNRPGGLISPVTRKRLMDALGEFVLAGDDHSILEMLRDHWPDIGTASTERYNWTLEDDIVQHYLKNPEDWSTADLLKQLGFMTCSQGKVFAFLEDVVAPIRRDPDEQTRIVGHPGCHALQEQLEISGVLEHFNRHHAIGARLLLLRFSPRWLCRPARAAAPLGNGVGHPGWRPAQPPSHVSSQLF